MIKMLNAIVEVRCKPSKKGGYWPLQDKIRADHMLRHSSFAGCPVIGIVTEHDGNPTDIPCFGFNVHTKIDPDKRVRKGGCKTYRYFGTTVIVEGNFMAENLATYSLGRNAQVDICGVGTAEPQAPVERKRLSIRA